MAKDQSLTAGSRSLKAQMLQLSPLVDELNRRLNDAEAHFRELPIKREVYTPAGEGEAKFFGFDKYRGEWALVIGYYDPDASDVVPELDLSEMSLDQRIELAAALPAINDMISECHDKLTVSLRSSVETLRGLGIPPRPVSYTPITEDEIPF